mmetsp:Transcript_19231/g.61182  ORF Transcript_19231/g.61182 Transcript_19231/m.61182 type:complete len:295 (+) Transcript_19231:2-886(+)
MCGAIFALLALLVLLAVLYFVWPVLRARKIKDGDVVLITGASAGIGAALARHYARRRARLVLAARRADKLGEVAEACKQLGAPDVLVVPTDVTKEQDCKALVERAMDRFLRIDLLLLNAGVGCMVRFDELKDLKSFRDTMEINYWGYVNMTFYALPFLRKCGGRICAISSLAGHFGVPTRTGYAPTKWAVNGFFNSLRCEVGHQVGITVVCPGFVLSEIHDRAHGMDGAAARRNMSHFMSADRCAELTARAVDHGRRELVMTALGKLGVALKPFVPGLLDRMAIRKALSAVRKG